MKKYLALVSILLSMPALAEESKTYTLTLSGQEISYIGQVLSTRPYSEVVGLLNKLQTQLSEQDKKEEKKKTKDTPEN